ncbi:hypothetical protein [Candidatus Nanohalobium constans]|nr:hypothetical protein [Candidatus Nanohalobium constans]
MRKPSRVDAFGNSLEIEVYQNPESFLDENPGAESQLVDVAQDAFSKDGVPTEEDAEDHLRVPLLVTAKDESGECVGFSAVSREGDMVYEEGLAVRDDEEHDFHGSCVGSTLLSRGVMEMAEGEEVLGYRTQNPNMYACADNCFNLEPAPDEEIEMLDEIQELGNEVDPSKEMDGAVMRKAYADIYDGGMYSGVPENKEFQEFMYGEDGLNMNFEDGDALIVAGEVSETEAAHSMASAARASDYEFHENGEKIA